MTRLHSLALVFALVAVGLGRADAQTPSGPASLKGDVMFLYASMDKGSIDKKIGKLPQLKKPPFSQFKTWKLLSKTAVALPRDAAQTISLPNGNSLILTYKGPIAPAKKGDPVRFSIGAVVKKKDGTSQAAQPISSQAGDTFLVSAGQQQTGYLMVAVKVTP